MENRGGKETQTQDIQKINTYETENYVHLNLDRHQRSILAQLRSGILPLQVELGRYNNIKVEDRKCTLCTMDTVEDECHFLFHCTMYNKYREDFFSELPINLPLQNDFELLSTLFKSHTRKLAKYACKIFDFRQKQLFRK